MLTNGPCELAFDWPDFTMLASRNSSGRFVEWARRTQILLQFDGESAMPEVKSSLCAMPMTSSWVSSTKVKPDASWQICGSEWKSSRYRCIRIRRVCFRSPFSSQEGYPDPERMNVRVRSLYPKADCRPGTES
jgi:hypothetical protein